MSAEESRGLTTSDTSSETKSASCQTCCKVLLVLLVIIVVLGILLIIGFLIWYSLFGIPKPKVPSNLEKSSFYAEKFLSKLPLRAQLTLTFPSDMLSHLSGKQQLAIVFSRQESNFRDVTPFQVAMISMTRSYKQLKALVPKPRYLVKKKFPLKFYFKKYPLQLRFEIAYGAIEDGKFLWAASSTFVKKFSSRSTEVLQKDIDVKAPNKLASALLTKAVKVANLTNGLEVAAISKENKVGMKLTQKCNNHYYGKDCAVYCRPTNNAKGHYKCDKNGTKVCRPGWLNASNNCLEKDHCFSVTCLNGGTCQNGKTEFKCLCVPQYTGKLCNDDVNECSSAPCLNGATCQNSRGGYKCICRSNAYVGKHCASPNQAQTVVPTEIAYLIILSVLSVIFLE